MGKKSRTFRTKEAIRSYTMSRIKSKDTAIEVALRKALWHSGIRYRKNYQALPGKPDIAITRHKIAVFCDGEFWHGKNWDTVKNRLQTRSTYWIAKIERTIERDNATERKLTSLGWTVLRFWGKDIEKNLALCVAEVKEAIFHAKIDWSHSIDYQAEFDGGESMAAERAEAYSEDSTYCQ